ncbi:ATP-binding protein [Noviherbaspirillum sp. ST9]|uniref:hybrid sensor histidine kinase/response regulator n=1 Tax=Noviherbaspirillum sp. ST9 TaxID=3401606 RepID=UPI003B585CF2
MKIRTYLTLTAAAVLVPVILFAAVALNMLLNAERKAALRAVHETARATALSVDRELAAAEARLRALATSQHLTRQNLDSFYWQARNTLGSEEGWIVLFDRSGQQLVNTRTAFGDPLPRRSRPEIGIETMRNGSVYVSNLLHGNVVNRPVISVEVPVPHPDGPRFILSQAFVAEYFNRVFDQAAMAPDGVIGIFDRDGLTVARSRGAAEFVGKPTVPDLIEAARSADEGMLRTRNLEGKEVYGIYTRSKMSGWIVAVGVPINHIEDAARKAVLVSGIGLLAAIAGAIVVAYLLGRRLADAIGGAVRSATALGRGEQPAETSSGVVEVDRLHAALAEAGTILRRERDSRTAAEAERAALFASEQEARRLAEQQNKTKDEFLAMLGHELRNPLGAISNAVAIMETAGLSAESSQRAQAVISRQSQHLARIVDDLLDVSRVMSGKVFLNRQHLDLAESVRHCVASLSGTRRIGAHTLDVDVEPAWVDADPTRIEQVISNLLLNAAKYTPGAGCITVRVRACEGKAMLTVSDNGIGIPAQLMSQIFDVFVQGPAQLDRSQGGLGIGLALVQRLVMLHGGTVTAHSDGAGKGSMFIVALPLATEAGNAGSLGVPHPAAGGGYRVLLVEDNEDNRQTLSAVLSIFGHTVSAAGDGSAGLQAAMEEVPDVAVIDIGLPGIDGYEVARRLRASPVTRGIRLVAVTGYGQQEDRDRALAAGFDVHLVKPVEPARLLEAINRLAH